MKHIICLNEKPFFSVLKAYAFYVDDDPSRPQDQKWRVYVRHDDRPQRPWRRTWSATVSHGVGHLADSSGGVYRSSTREKLLRKMFVLIDNECLRHGFQMPPDVEVEL